MPFKMSITGMIFNFSAKRTYCRRIEKPSRSQGKTFKGAVNAHEYDAELKLLISPMNVQEASEAIEGGADIIDVKNPMEGALGANFPWVIRQIKAITPLNIQVSCAIGDGPNLPGFVSLAAHGAATLGVDYVKVGLSGCKTTQEAVYLLQNVTQAAKQANPKIKVAAAGYADAQRVDALDPMLIPDIAFKAQADVAMLDTWVKDGKSILMSITTEQLRKFSSRSHHLGLEVAMAGSLRKEDLPVIYDCGADIAGLRGAACTRSDRVKGEMKRSLVAELAETVKQAEKQQGIPRA